MPAPALGDFSFSETQEKQIGIFSGIVNVACSAHLVLFSHFFHRDISKGSQQPLTHRLSLSLSPLQLSHSLSGTNTHTHTHTLSLSLSLSLTHTHTHTPSHT
jgi:hypothetical protein